MSECTTKGCDNEAEYGLFLFAEDRFSRAWGTSEQSENETGEIHPHVCEECEPHYAANFQTIGEFRRLSDEEE